MAQPYFNLLTSRHILALFVVLLCNCAFELLGTVKGSSEENIAELVQQGDLHTLEQILFDSPDVVDHPDATGQRPLMIALKLGDEKMASILLAYGANVTEPDHRTLEAPAHIAVRQKQFQMLSLLFAYAADPDQRDKMGISPRQAAGLNERLIEIFRKYDKGGAEAFEDPPGYWVRQADSTTGKPYFFNTQTYETQRKPPPSCGWRVGTVEGHPVYINRITKQTRWTRPTALSWRRVNVPQVQHAFWLNYRTNTSMLEIPAELPASEYKRLMEETNAYWFNEVTEQSSWEDPRENSWRAVLDRESGKNFYYHPVTLDSTWDPPEEVAWRAIESRSARTNSTQVFYYNDATGTSQWEKPAWLGWSMHDEL